VIKEKVFPKILDSPVLATGLSLTGKVVVAVTAGLFVSEMGADGVDWHCFYKKRSFWSLIFIIGVGSWFRHSISKATYDIIDSESARKHLFNRAVPKLGDYMEREIDNGNLQSIDEVMDKVDGFE